MELFKTFQLLVHLIASTIVLTPLTSINGQISTPCTVSMIASFTPCLNFVTGSSNNGTSPTTSCCGSLKSIMSTSMDCACLLITANVPLQLPINRPLSLPKACNMSGVPLQCKSSGTPLPAPGPVLLGPTPPTIAPSLSPRGASKLLARAPAPQSETTNQKLTPVASPPLDDGSEVPTKTAGIRPVLSPPASSSSTLSTVLLSFLLQSIVVDFVFKVYE